MIILDGSIGQELLKRTEATPTGLWSTQVMRDHPEAVRDIHTDYFRAGALIATTNTYAIHRDRLAPVGVEDQFQALHHLALTLANEARDAFGSGHVAGSLGPLVASYRPDLSPPPDVAAEAYAEIAKLHAPYVDLILLETMTSLDMVKGALMGASSAGKPVWLAISVDDADGTKLRSGEPVADLASAIEDHKPAAILVNCSQPEAVTQALIHLPRSFPIGGYANGFTKITDEIARPGGTVTDLASRDDLGPEAYAAYALRWADDGATILGGCCEVGPAHISELCRTVDVNGYTRLKELTL